MNEPNNSTHRPTTTIASTSRRFIFALALLPIVPTVSVIGMTAITDFAPFLIFKGANIPIGGNNFDELRWFHMIFAVLWVTATILIWRGAVIWTLGREWLTALVSVIPFIQLIYGEPLWTAPGCRLFDDELLRVGQFQLGAGLFVWLAVWAWWGTEKLTMSVKERKPRMFVGPLAPSFAMALGLQPIIFAVFLLVLQALQDLAGITNITAVFSLTAVVAVVAWLMIWRRHVRGPGYAVAAILMSLCLAIPLLLQWRLAAPTGSTFLDVVLISLPIIGWGVFMAGTIALWPLREFSMHADGPRCLRCGYSLRGLKATRCPECGDEPTLDQLWGATDAAHNGFPPSGE